MDFQRTLHNSHFLQLQGFINPICLGIAPQRWIDQYSLEEIQVRLQPNDLSYSPEISRRWVKEMPADDATLKAEGLK